MIHQKINDFFTKSSLDRLFLLTAMIMFPIALLPNDFVASTPLLKDLCDFFAGYISYLKVFSEHTDFPYTFQLNQIVGCAILFVGCLYGFGKGIFFEIDRRWDVARCKSHGFLALILVFPFSLSIYLVFFQTDILNLFDEKSSVKVLNLFLSYRIVLSFFGFFLVSWVAFLFVIFRVFYIVIIFYYEGLFDFLKKIF